MNRIAHAIPLHWQGSAGLNKQRKHNLFVWIYFKILSSVYTSSQIYKVELLFDIYVAIWRIRGTCRYGNVNQEAITASDTGLKLVINCKLFTEATQ